MTAVLIDELCREHLLGREHPERPERFDAVVEGLAEAGLTPRLKRVETRAATDEELALVHTPAYIRVVRHDVTRESIYLSTGDTEIGPNSLNVAARAAGGVLNAVDMVMGGKAANAFCAVRPPG